MIADLKTNENFKYVVLLYSLLGMNGAIVFTYFGYYVIHSIGVRNTILYMNLGTVLGILLLPLYRKLLSRVKTYNSAVILANTIFFIADIFILIAYYYPSYGKIAAFLNVFTAIGMGIMYSSFFDGYVMHLYGFQNRAKITSVSQAMMNTAGATMLFASYLFYKNPLLTITIAEIVRLSIMLIFSHAPKIEYGKLPEMKRNFSLGGAKIALIIFAIFSLQIATSIYGTAKPKIIEDTIGSNYISISGAFSRILIIILFLYAMKYTTAKNKMVRRIGWTIIVTSLFFFLSPANKLLLFTSITAAQPLILLYIMSTRHYAFKSLPPEETKNVLYTISYSNYFAGIMNTIIAYFIVTNALGYYYIATTALSLAAAFIAASKIVEKQNHGSTGTSCGSSGTS